MFIRKLLPLFLSCFFILVLSPKGRAQQACSTLGQNPGTAFPVCGTSVFKQASIPSCGGRDVPVPQCGVGYTDINPFWYQFTCFASGTLGFLITPNTITDDYDWQLFDITGHNPTDVYTTPSLFVCCNWSGNSGVTGTATNNNGFVNCGGYGYPTTSSMPGLVQGHNYLLLVSHFTSTNQSGYSLSFGGGTASITDTVPPAMSALEPNCDGSSIEVILDKRMKCSSLAADGSDFTITPLPAGVKVTGASALSCTTGFDMDTVLLTLSGPLPGGNYTVTANNGSDGNTILDNCDNQIPAGQSLPFTILPPQPTLLDSLTPPGCAPDQIQLVFPLKRIQCSSISADGSDFTVTGPYPVQVTGASGVCDGSGTTAVILVHLSAPILTKGDWQIRLAPGTDGNTLVDRCGQITPPTTLPFSTSDTVSAHLLADPVLFGCIRDTIAYDYPSANGIDYWQWVFDGTDTSLLQHPPERIYSVFGNKTVQLIVSNEVCSDTAKLTISLDNAVNVTFEGPNLLCPKDYAPFVNNSTGLIDTWAWDFGDGTTSDQKTPPDHLFPLTGAETDYTVRLIASNTLGCSDTVAHTIDVLRSCYIAVPGAFTPNGDGLNDYLYPLNALKARNLIFRVYNRYGQLVFETNDWTKKWDGTLSGHAEPPGTFVWVLQYTDGDSGKRIFQKGTTVLIR